MATRNFCTRTASVQIVSTFLKSFLSTGRVEKFYGSRLRGKELPMTTVIAKAPMQLLLLRRTENLCMRFLVPKDSTRMTSTASSHGKLCLVILVRLEWEPERHRFSTKTS